MAARFSRTVGAVVSAALVVATLVVAPTTAQAAGAPAGAAGTTAGTARAAVIVDSPVIINEVYGGGGNSGATITRDFVELYNSSSAAISLDGWSIQYASAAGTTWQTTALTGSVAAQGYFLVGQATGTGGTVTPDVDVNGVIAMGGTNGKVALVNSSAALSCAATCSTAAGVVDFVGYGNANDAAGGKPVTGMSNTASVSRSSSHTNTGNNAADFTAGDPTPQAATSTDPEEPVDPADPEVLSIAEIQGTGAASPKAGTTVQTTGVVTAVYPTGGFRGYTIQTADTGGMLGAGHLASDAVFVFSADTVGQVDINDLVQVTGVVSEFDGLTEITVPADGLVALGTAAVTAAQVGWPATDAQRETLESMLYQPSGDFTVTNTFATNQYGEVGLAAGRTPLRQPTDVALPGSNEAAAVAADNAARAVTLDDGATINFLSSANSALTPPYVSLTEPVRVGELVTFTKSVIVDYRNNTWKLNPTSQVTPNDESDYPVDVKNDRVAAPDATAIAKNGEPDLRIASFNVLNYFTTLGKDVPGCTSFNDRTGAPIAVNSCPGNGPRGAWDEASLQRQQDKIVTAINGLDADVVGLSEIENSAVVSGTPDAALATLVAALNTAAGSDVWKFVPSSADLPAVEEMDVISNAIIYRAGAVTPTGDARALGTESGSGEAFGNAREPIAQVFTPTGGLPFLFVMNHFKSKGSGEGPDADQGDGQGASNYSRVRQVTALRDWIPSVQGSAAAVALVGDFNSYGQEDPLRVLYDAGYVDAEQQFDVAKSSYSFSGLSGSLDHILINPAAVELATGADIWNINSGESIALQYSRYNYHGTLFYDSSAFASSDHDPVILGLKKGVPVPTVVLTASASSQVYGSPKTVTLTATVSSTGGPVTGSVDFVNGTSVLGSAPIVNGQATFTLPSTTPAGTLSVVAKFTGTPASESAAVTVTVEKATSVAALLATKTSYLQNPFLPAILVGAVALNNGQPARGAVTITQNGVAVATVAVTSGFFLWVVPRNLSKGTYEYVATFVPSDQANISGVNSNGIFIQIR